MSLAQEETELLMNFVRCVFDRWYGLQAAIQHGMGGSPAQTKKKLDDMTLTIARLCSCPDIGEDDISDALEDIVDKEFDLLCDDGSIDAVAQHLWTDTRDLLAGNSEKIRTFINKNTAPPPVIFPPCQPVEEDMDADDADSDKESDSKSPEKSTVPNDTVPNDDGWEVPRYGRRKR